MALSLVAAAALAANAFLGGRETSCQQADPLVVVADPAIAPALSEVAEAYVDGSAGVGGVCAAVDVVPLASASVAGGVGGEVPADLWIPDSSLWTTQVATEGVDVTVGEPVATSPLVVVASQPAAEQAGWPDATFSWSAVLEGDATATITDPTTTGEGLATLLAVGATVGVGQADPTQLVAAMTAISRGAVESVSAAYEQLAADPAAAPMFTATEQSVVSHNASSPGNPVVALYPSEGTLVLDYPVVTVSTASTTAATEEAAAAFDAALRTPEAVAVLTDAGFRTPGGEPDGDAGIVDGTQVAMPTVLPTPEPSQAAHILRQWAALSIDSQLLAVIDVSGSMNEQVEGGGTRIDLTVEAAKTALGLFPPTSSIGLWAFSVNQDPPVDHVELVPIRPLGEDVDGVSHQQALVDAVDSLAERAQGGTALYDTVLAAFRTVRSIYDPEKINSVVLLTDGRNEDDPDGIDLETLLTTLRVEVDPARPIPVIMIGMTDQADMSALTRISEATGARAYQAVDPRDIQQVFLDAMVERQCRPNC
ncbi:MAG: substrate-binding domain-containing protein [Jiangellaceae bacterium]